MSIWSLKEERTYVLLYNGKEYRLTEQELKQKRDDAEAQRNDLDKFIDHVDDLLGNHLRLGSEPSLDIATTGKYKLVTDIAALQRVWDTIVALPEPFTVIEVAKILNFSKSGTRRYLHTFAERKMLRPIVPPKSAFGKPTYTQYVRIRQPPLLKKEDAKLPTVDLDNQTGVLDGLRKQEEGNRLLMRDQ